MEYREGTESCSDCGATLVAGPMPLPPPRMAEDWEAMMRVRKESNAAIIRGLLESHEIPCEVISKALSEMPIPAAFASYFEIWVPKASLDRARKILNEVRKGTVPCGTCGHMSAAEEPRCEYCDADMG